jgi:hypothetical protein
MGVTRTRRDERGDGVGVGVGAGVGVEAEVLPWRGRRVVGGGAVSVGVSETALRTGVGLLRRWQQVLSGTLMSVAVMLVWVECKSRQMRALYSAAEVTADWMTVTPLPQPSTNSTPTDQGYLRV